MSLASTSVVVRMPTVVTIDAFSATLLVERAMSVGVAVRITYVSRLAVSGPTFPAASCCLTRIVPAA